MMKSQAKLLKADDRVLWISGNEKIGGVVIWKRYNTIKIRWDDGVEKTHYADTMDNVFTQEQLDKMKAEREVVEKIIEYNKAKLKEPTE